MPKKAEKSQVKREINKRTPSWFLIVSFIISLGSILLNFFLKDYSVNLFIIVLDIIIIVWLIINVVMLTKFVKNKYEKGAVWISGLYIFDFAFSFIVAVIAGAYAGLNGISPEGMMVSPVVRILTNIFPAVILVLCARLITRK